ncbi:putative transcription factor GRF family [Helianthus anomalus]
MSSNSSSSSPSNSVAVNRSSRHGEEFYGCSLWPRSDCKFFVWKQEVDAVLARECNCGVLEEENRRLRKSLKKACFLAVVCIALSMYWLF